MQKVRSGHRKRGIKDRGDVIHPRQAWDILLVTLPPWGVENPPIGLGCLDSYVRERGLKPRVYDFNIYFHNTVDNAYKRLWHVENKNYWSNDKTFPVLCELFKEQMDFAVGQILSCDTNLIGFSVVDPKEKLTVELIRRIKKAVPEKIILLGGPACSTEEQRNFFVESLGGGVDYFVVGEGEETLCEIIQKEKGSLKLPSLAGVAVKENGRWRYVARAPLIPLDKINFPKYEGFELEQYHGGKSLLVQWSRGCIGKCSFCKNYRLNVGYRAKSPDLVFKEMEYFSHRYGIKEFTVCDNLMNGDIRQLHGVCDRLAENKLDIKWSGQIAPRKEMDANLFSKMRRTGCDKIQIGVESGSDKVLRNMRKLYSVQTAQENIKLAKGAGMEVEIFIIVGFPGETEAEFKKTQEFIKRNASYIHTIKSINTLHLIAGTDVYENPARYNIKPLPANDWHYLWKTHEGNSYEARKRRAKQLLDLASGLGLKVMETNIEEGKEELFVSQETIGLTEQLEKLRVQISRLQELPKGVSRLKFKRKRWVLKSALLVLVSLYTFFYITYFWLYKKLKGKTLLGGG